MEIPRNMSMRKVLSLLLIVILSSAAITYVFTVTMGQGTDVGDVTEQWYTPSQEATYIVGVYNSTHYYLQNHTGAGSDSYAGYEWLSTNATQIFSSAIGNMTQGKIQVRSGIYDFGSTSALIPSFTFSSKENITLIGEDGVIFQKTANLIIYILNSKQITIENIDFFFTTREGATAIYVNGTGNRNLAITNCRFESNSSAAVIAGADMIYFAETFNQLTDGLRISNNEYVSTDIDAISLHGVRNAWIQNNIIREFGKDAVQATGILISNSGSDTSENVHVIHNEITGSMSTGLKIGIGCHNDEKEIAISDNIIYNIGVGIGLWEVDYNCQVTGNLIDGNKTGAVADYHGIAIVGRGAGDEGLDITIGDNVIRNVGKIGIYVQRIFRAALTGNTIYNTKAQGIVICWGSPYTQIVGNTIYDAADDGIQCYASTNSIISNNWIYSNTQNGIQLASTSDNHLITNNYITGNTFEGIYIDNCDNNEIIGNRLEVNTDYGVKLSAGSTNNKISNNRFVSNTNGPISDVGIGTIIEDNYGYNVGAAAEPSEASYTIFVSGTTYYMWNGTTGLIDFSSTNATLVFRNALGNATSGFVFVKAGTYNIDDYFTLYKNSTLKGAGAGATILKATENLNYMILIDPSVTSGEYCWAIEDLQIEMDNKNGDAIYSTYACHTAQRPGSHIYNVLIDYVAAGYCGVNFTNIQRLDIRHLFIRSYGTCMKITESNIGFNWGDSQMSNCWFQLLGNNAVGLNITSTDFNNQAGNIFLIDELDIYMVNTLTGTYGVYIKDGQYLCFTHLHIENARYCVYGDDIRYSAFLHPTFFGTLAGCQGFYMIDSSRNNIITGGSLRMNGDEIYDHSYLDGTAKARFANVYRDVALGDTPSVDILKNAELYNCQGYTPYGVIANPASLDTMDYYLHHGNNGTIANDTTYYICNSPMTFYMSGGTLIDVTVDGTVVSTTNTVFTLQPKQTVRFRWTVAVTIITMAC